jgi:DNA polymerase-3 subunit delta'
MRLCFNYGSKAADILKKSEEFQKLGRENQKELLSYALGLLRKVLLFGIDPKFVPHLAGGEQQFVLGFARFVTLRNADALTKELTDAHYHIERNANPKMVFVDSSLRLGGQLRQA